MFTRMCLASLLLCLTGCRSVPAPRLGEWCEPKGLSGAVRFGAAHLDSLIGGYWRSDLGIAVIVGPDGPLPNPTGYFCARRWGT